MRPTRSFGKASTLVTRNHARVLSGNIQFGMNNNDQAKNILGFHAQNVTTPASPNTEFSIVHNLGFVPNRFWVTNMNANANIYSSGTPWTSTTIYLKCSGSSVGISLFVD